MGWVVFLFFLFRQLHHADLFDGIGSGPAQGALFNARHHRRTRTEGEVDT
jgi:hypothetical protein